MQREAGRPEEAEQCFRRVHELDPRDAEALIHLGSLLHERAQPADAAAALEKSIGLQPNLAPAHYHLGLARRALSDVTGARESFRAAARLDPASAEAQIGLGNLLADEGRVAEAIAHYARAIGYLPRNARLHNNLGCALRLADRLDEAVSSFRKAIELEPEFSEAHLNLGDLYTGRREYEPAAACYAAGMKFDPEHPAFADRLLFAMQQLCDWSRFDELSAKRRQHLSERPDELTSPFSLLCIPSSPREQLECARNFSRRLSERMAAERARLDFRFGRAPKQRLRIGYLSGDFYQHVTAYVLAEILELHDRGAFEIYAYSYSPNDGSALRARIAAAFDVFVEIAHLSDTEAAARMHADGIDILVDINGYSQGGRMGISALKPAPVQVSYLAYPGTTGAPFIDYLIADRFLIPPGGAADFGEAPVLMPASHFPSDRKRQVAPPPTRAAAGLPTSGFVFCCFNQTFKILPEMFAVWMRLLLAVPGSVLWLLEGSPLSSANLRREAARHGVDQARLIFSPRIPPERYLGRLRAADLFLDTFPYNAHTTANDALWVGLPVVTRSGSTFASRVAGSQLRAAGLPGLVVESTDDYESLALRLARDPAELAAVRAALERNRSTSPLFDMPRYARDLERAYAMMWSAYVAGSRPQPIEL